MIIIKTNNGAKFVNEKEAVMVCHDKKAKQVSFHTRETMQGVTINDVESVTYVSDAHPFEYKDEGSEIENLKKQLEDEKRENNKIYKHSGFMREWFFIYQEAFDRIKYEYEKAERENKGFYANPVAIINEAERKYAESQKQFKKLAEIWDKSE